MNEYDYLLERLEKYKDSHPNIHKIWNIYLLKKNIIMKN